MEDSTRLLRTVAVGVGVVWFPIVIAWGPAPFTLTFDDAYYYFQIAREIAHGHGSTFNGIDLTNGYHPLWQAICVVPFLLGLTGLAAVRALLVLQLAVWVATLWVVSGAIGSRLSRRAAVPVAIVLALVGGNPAVLKLFVNGLESGVAALAYALLLVHAAQRRKPNAIVLIIVFLARTDAVFVIGALALWLLFEERDVRALRPFVPVGVVAALYLGSNWLFFGNPLQVSGVVKRQPLSIGRVIAMLIVAAAAFAVAAGCRRLSARRFVRTGELLAATGWFAGACVLLVGYYRVLSVEVYLWYYAPVALYLIVLLLHVAADMAEGVLAEGQSLVPIASILTIPFAIAVVLGTRQITDPQLRSLELGDRAAALWVRDNTPKESVVASWDAGVIGYFADRPVVNLDGVVNSFGWRDALHRAPVETRAFLDARHVTLIVNHGRLANGEDPDIRHDVEALYGPGRGITQLHREEYVYSGALGGVSGTRVVATFVYELSVAA